MSSVIMPAKTHIVIPARFKSTRAARQAITRDTW